VRTIYCFLIAALALASTGAAPAQTFSVLHTFQFFPHGASPYSAVHRDPSTGDLYGTTNGGGAYDAGGVFKLDTTGRMTVLHTFTGGTDGGSPVAGVVADSAGNLYGTTYQGGIAGAGPHKLGAGVVYRIDASGQFSVVYTFTGGADGGSPTASVTVDSSGDLYGTTYYGGTNGDGAVYKVNPAGQETVLYSFLGPPDGANPYAGVTVDSAGNFYGTTYAGGEHEEGTVFKLAPSGQETALCSFGTVAAGGDPIMGVILDSAGNLYGANSNHIYELSPSGVYTEVAYLGANTNISGLTRDSAGNFYGIANPGGAPNQWPHGAVFEVNARGGTVTTLYKFEGSEVFLGGNENPSASVALDWSGNLYGTTPFAGTAGIVYEVETSGAVKTLYDFQPASGGTTPWSALTLAAGKLYGTTRAGGPANAGVVYRTSPAGQETILYSFKGGPTDGSYAETGVVLDGAGNLYGVTSRGGADDQGVVYKLTSSGEETILHSFTGGADGALPTGLAIDPAGNLYGATAQGGAGSQTGAQEGVVFELNKAGYFTVLYSFTGLSDGGNPEGGVTLDASGNLYGTTNYGGIGSPGAGVVFEIDTAGHYSVLHAFLASSDGGYPAAGVTLDAAGNLYGTCSGDGPNGGGTVFELTAGGDFVVRYAFQGGPEDGFPMAGVTRDEVGNLFGTISVAANSSYCPGVPNACGLVYEIDIAGNKTILYGFTGGADGADPMTPVTLGSDGRLYGVATGLFDPVGGGVLFRIALH
jgi:uncharacterized repeat protein (TIGR03803 family)